MRGILAVVAAAAGRSACVAYHQENAALRMTRPPGGALLSN